MRWREAAQPAVDNVLYVSVRRLNRPEIEALFDAPDTTTWLGQRDHLLLLVAVETGLRVSELTALRCKDVQLGHGAHVRCHGKGRKERCTPLSREAVRVLKLWLPQRGDTPVGALFPSLRRRWARR